MGWGEAFAPAGGGWRATAKYCYDVTASAWFLPFSVYPYMKLADLLPGLSQLAVVLPGQSSASVLDQSQLPALAGCSPAERLIGRARHDPRAPHRRPARRTRRLRSDRARTRRGRGRADRHGWRLWGEPFLSGVIPMVGGGCLFLTTEFQLSFPVSGKVAPRSGDGWGNAPPHPTRHPKGDTLPVPATAFTNPSTVQQQPLVPSRPRYAVVSRDGPVYGRRPACFDTGLSGPAQHEDGGGKLFTSGGASASQACRRFV